MNSMVQATLKREGRLDILVNNAGIAIRRPAVDLARGDWDKVLSVNLTGSFLCARAAAGPMIAAGNGHYVIIDRPDAIIDATTQVVRSVRTNSKL